MAYLAQVVRGVTRVLDPGRHLRERQAALALAPTVENRTALADAWLEAGEPAKAVDLYSECLAGIYRTDRLLMGRLAGALHAAGYNARARRVFEDLLRLHGPLSDGGELLSFASTLEACGETAGAERSFRAAAEKSGSMEGRYRLVAFLRRAGKTAEAEKEVGSMLQGFALMPRFAKRDQRRWVDAARRDLAQA
jgi:hypothetical protein